MVGVEGESVYLKFFSPFENGEKVENEVKFFPFCQLLGGICPIYCVSFKNDQ